MDELEFRVLGPIEVWRGPDPVPIGAARQRGVLAALLLQSNRVVSADRLIELLWGDEPPVTARNTLHSLVRRLRELLDLTQTGSAPALETRPPGYLLRVEPSRIDLHRFDLLAQRGRHALAAGQADSAARLFREAIGLWRGQPLADVAAVGLRLLEAPRLEEQYLQVNEDRIEAELAVGRHAELVGELRALVAQHPLRERLHGQLMLSLHRSGRQADALKAYQDLRRLLVDELGLEPGPELQRLHRAVLKGDDDRPRAVMAPPIPLVPAQLPADVAGFTGRRAALEQLDSLLRRAVAPVVVVAAVVGSAGVGKTALTVHWAHRVAGRFEDGQLHVNLRGYASAAPMRPIDALAQFLRALGVPAERVPAETQEAAALYRTLLANRRVLVILDNARGPDQIRPLLPGSPGCLVVVTSRDRLDGLVAKDGAHRIPLDVLSPVEAHDLLGRVLGEERVLAEPAAVAELAQACAHLPLALRIAAANVPIKSGAGVAQAVVAQYNARMVAGNRLSALQVAGDDEAAVRRAFDLSYLDQTGPARGLFRLLGLVPGPDITVEAAAQLAGVSTMEAARWLDGLAAAHLIHETTPGRVTFHDLLRTFAGERAEAEEEADLREAAVERLYSWYLTGVDRAAVLLYPERLRLPAPGADAPLSFTDESEASAWLDAERRNLIVAIEYAAENGPAEMAWRLADALRGYFYLRMTTVDWMAAARAGLSQAEAEGDEQAQAALQLSLAEVHWRQNQHQLAVTHYTRAGALSRAAGWLSGEVAAACNLGTVYGQLGQLGQAAEEYARALEVNRRTGRLDGQAPILGNLAITHLEMGNPEQAAHFHGQALDLFIQIGSRGGQAVALSGVAEACLVLGRLDEAMGHLRQSLAILQEIGNRGDEGEILRILAEVHRDSGRPDEALTTARTALALARDTADQRREAFALNTLASIHDVRGEHAQAIENHREALRLAREIGSRFPEALALLGLATTLHHLGRREAAVVQAGEALSIAQQYQYGAVAARAHAAVAAGHL